MTSLVHAWRSLRRSAAFAAFSTATVAFGLAAATALFAMVKVTLLDALPVDRPGELVWMYNARTERDRAPFSLPDLDDYVRDTTTLAGLATFTNWTANLTGDGDAERLEGTRVSGGFFPLLGTRAAFGRLLDARDEAAEARVAVLAYGLWKRRFGGDPSVIGREVVLNGASYTVVGVLPPRFVFPFRYTEIAVPVSYRADPRRANRGANFLRVVARLAPAVTLAQAKTDLDAIARRLQRTFPDDDARKTGVNLFPLHAEIMSDYTQILWVSFAAVAVLLAVGCGNLANLLLARALGRRSELALRMALGASRGFIARELIAEAVLLSAAGCLVGVWLASRGLSLFQAFGPADFPQVALLAIDRPVLAFAAAAAVAVAMVCGAVPALAVSRELAAQAALETRTTTAHRQLGRTRRAFVAAQVTGAAILLVCSGLVGRSFVRLGRIDPGFTSDRALSMQLTLPPNRYATRASMSAFSRALAPELAVLPGVRAAGAVSLLPLSGLLATFDISFPDRPAPPPDEVPQAHYRIATPGYFEAAGIRVLAGRTFNDLDTADGRPVVIVSRTFVDRHWPGEAAVGRQLRIVQPPPSPALDVIGVVADVKQAALDGVPTADVYVPLDQMHPAQASLLAARMNWVMRTDGDPRTLVDAARTAVRRVDADVAASATRTLDEVLAAARGPRRTNLQLLGVFGVAALLLSAAGVYAVSAQSAAARARELAIRSAYGASRMALLRLVFVQEGRAVLVGVVVGLAAAAAIAPAISRLLVATSGREPATYAVAAIVLLVSAGLSIAVTAIRATAVDPAALLKM